MKQTKVPSSIKKGRSEGEGTKKGGGKPASVGHLYGFGNTEEFYRVSILGCRERGRKRDGPFNHETGHGWVQAVKGSYYDAIVTKRLRVIPMIVEAQGGVTRHALAHMSHLARRAKGRRSRDSTTYGTSRTSTRCFFVHHLQRLSVAATRGHAAATLKSIGAGKQGLAAGGQPAAGAF